MVFLFLKRSYSPFFILWWYAIKWLLKRWNRHYYVVLGYYWPSGPWLMLGNWNHRKENHGERGDHCTWSSLYRDVDSSMSQGFTRYPKTNNCLALHLKIIWGFKSSRMVVVPKVEPSSSGTWGLTQLIVVFPALLRWTLLVRCHGVLQEMFAIQRKLFLPFYVVSEGAHALNFHSSILGNQQLLASVSVSYEVKSVREHHARSLWRCGFGINSCRVGKNSKIE